ncbi:MAG TPA: S49 family peptidase [Bryobacteraceae bacterium]
MNFIHLQTRLFDTPLAILESKFEVIVQAIGPRLGLDLHGSAIEAAIQTQAAQQKSYSMTPDGIAVIPIQGTLLKKASGLMAMSGCTSYESLGMVLQECMSSPSVKGILLDIDSPGGEVSGLFDLADSFYSAKSKKPSYAVSNDSAFSAAYALASCADRIFITRTAGVGSVGVFCSHVDQSAADQKAGLKFTYIKAGAKKTQGNPHEPLTEQATSDLQAEVQREYQMFVELVARNRGVGAQSVIDTEAGCFFAENAIPLLADQVGTFDDALAALTALVAATPQAAFINSSTNQEASMKKKATTTATSEETPLVAAIEAEDEMENPEQCATPDADPDNDDEDDEDEKKPEATDVKQILNLCKLAGADLSTASDFITNGFSTQQVIDALATERSTRSNKTKVNTTINTATTTVDALQEQALASADNPKKVLENFKALLRKNPSAYVNYVDSKLEAMALPSTKRKYVAELEAKYGQKLA